MPGWTRIQGVKPGDTFTRPLGLLESAFYWSSAFGGASDTIVQVTIECQILESSSLALFSLENVTRAWIALKNLHPLLCASVHERPSASEIDFVVHQAKLNVVGPDELVFAALQSDEEACALVDKILNEPRRLSNELLAQLWIVSFPQDPLSRSSSTCYQLLLHLAHSICDGVAQNAVIRAFLAILVHTSTPEIYIPKDSLESNLALHPAVDELDTARKYSPARRRWRFAIAKVMHTRRMATLKGGHTLPQSIAPQTPVAPSVSRTFRLILARELRQRVLTSCRKNSITFGQALPVLAQLAHSRVLHRLYANGSISEAEWAHRRTQPMHFAGPLNLRPYLDQTWLSTGGANRVCAAISFYGNTLSAMPTARSLDRRDLENPSFEALLSRARFFYRCGVAKRQTNNFLNHPLLMEFVELMRPMIYERNKSNAMKWREQIRAMDQAQQGHFQSVTTHDENQAPFVYANGCSTLGTMDSMVPTEYPSEAPNTPPPSRLRITSIRHYLRCRSAELYITSLSYLQELQLVVFCDIRAYNEELVKEWLSYIGQAIEWYLGGDDLTQTDPGNHMARL